MNTHFKTILLLLLPYGEMQAQYFSYVELINPSFEDIPRAGDIGRIITGWEDKGSENETPPDIQPGFFGVTQSPQNGRAYLGLVVRANNTWEGVGQQLAGFLEKDSIYSFSLWLARSNDLLSMTKSGKEALFNAPTILKIWGYNTQTGKEELLNESTAVNHSKWMLYEFVLKPVTGDFDELNLMAYYAPKYEQTNGNLLVDNCSAIVKISR